MYNLPNEVLVYIFEYCDHNTLLNLELVCHRFNELINENTLWSHLLKKHYKVFDYLLESNNHKKEYINAKNSPLLNSDDFIKIYEYISQVTKKRPLFAIFEYTKINRRLTLEELFRPYNINIIKSYVPKIQKFTQGDISFIFDNNKESEEITKYLCNKYNKLKMPFEMEHDENIFTFKGVIDNFKWMFYNNDRYHEIVPYSSIYDHINMVLTQLNIRVEELELPEDYESFIDI